LSGGRGNHLHFEHQAIKSVVGVPDKIEYEEKVIGIVEYIDGSIIDVIRKIK
jgi:citrate lyase subunit alpha/citrate CoA-transferase